MNFKIKLLLVFMVPLLSFVAASIYFLNQNVSNTKQLQMVLYETSYLAQSNVLNADRDMYQAMADYQSMQLQNGGNQQALIEDFHENVKQVDERLQGALEILRDQSELITDSNGRTVIQLLEEMKLNFDGWVTAAEANIASENWNDLVLHEKFELARADVDFFGDLIEQYASEQMFTISEENRNTAIIAFIVIAVQVIIILTAGLLLIRNMNRTIKLVTEKMVRIEDGNLQLSSNNKYSRDELGQILRSIDQMIIKMRGLIGSISSSTELVSVASTELTANADITYQSALKVNEHISEVNGQVEIQSTVSSEVSKAMEEMTVGIQRIAESTTSISEITMQSSEEAELGAVRLKQLSNQMSEMMESIGTLNQHISSLKQKSTHIGAITDNITAIANQTSILSLNASIEASRAGESGRGFAVIAEEIRKLAANSVESAQHINDLISETRQEIDAVSDSMNTTVSQVETGSAYMETAVKGFGEILIATKKVNEQMVDASAITEQMSAGSEEVSASMAHAAVSAQEVANKSDLVAKATSEQLTYVQDIHSAASSLQQVVQQLNGSVSQFKL